MYRDYYLSDIHADVVSQRQGVPLREAVHPDCVDMAEVRRDVQVAVALGQRCDAALVVQRRELGRLHSVAPAEFSARRPGPAMQGFMG